MPRNIGRGAELLKLAPPSFAVYSGDDPTAIALMLLGRAGNISVTANVAPRGMHELCVAAMPANSPRRRHQHQLMPLHAKLFVEPNPGAGQMALRNGHECRPACARRWRRSPKNSTPPSAAPCATPACCPRLSSLVEAKLFSSRFPIPAVQLLLRCFYFVKTVTKRTTHPGRQARSRSPPPARQPERLQLCGSVFESDKPTIARRRKPLRWHPARSDPAAKGQTPTRFPRPRVATGLPATRRA